jgi:mycothiol system anti-sigma-R factor
VITCAEAVKQLWDYLDGMIDGSQRELVEEHLAFCRRCCGELEFAQELRGFLATHTNDDLPPDVRARLSATLEGLGGA